MKKLFQEKLPAPGRTDHPIIVRMENMTRIAIFLSGFFLASTLESVLSVRLGPITRTWENVVVGGWAALLFGVLAICGAVNERTKSRSETLIAHLDPQAQREPLLKQSTES